GDPPAASLQQRLEGMTEAEAVQLADSIESPIASVALALAAEAYAASLPPEKPLTARSTVLRLATHAAQRSERLLEAPRLKQRYSHLAAIGRSAQERLSDSQPFLMAANQAMTAGDYNAALDHCRAGLTRHPKEAALWA